MDLTLLPFSQDLEKEFLTQLSICAEKIELEKDRHVTSQYEIGEYFHFLEAGEIEFSIKIDHEHEELKVGESDVPFTPIGWSGFREPYRYATTVSCLKNSSFLRWKHSDLRQLIYNYPASGMVFLEFIVYQSQLLLQETRNVLANYSQELNKSFLDLDPFQENTKLSRRKSLDILKRSPFFEVFNTDELIQFAELGKKRHYHRGEKIYKQDTSSESFDILIKGKIVLIYSQDNSNKLDKRIINNRGYVIGSGCFTHDHNNHVSCVALSNATVLRINYNDLISYFAKNQKIGIQFYLRLLWFISIRLRSTRAKLITIKYEGEIRAVKNLIEQNCTQLPVISELHKIPPLLAHTYTLGDAIQKLSQLKSNGTALEKNLASSSIDILSEVLNEHNFYQGISNLYHDVVNAPSTFSHFEVRKLCAERFVNVFEKSGYLLKGEENLPESPSIFIYNHLKNHEFNTLPNNFQLTLDSHFISSVILYKKYQNPGIRVVRVPKGDEYGHQYYYERLGHIPVYTKESITIEETKEEKKIRQQTFYDTASSYLQNGTSIMLAPEGQSFSTNSSPGDFKPGAFRLASYMKEEPLIVPIAMANFDKRLNHTIFTAVIKEPFLVSDKVEDPKNKNEMRAFLEKYSQLYKTYVEEAIDLSHSSNWISLVKE